MVKPNLEIIPVLFSDDTIEVDMKQIYNIVDDYFQGIFLYEITSIYVEIN